MHEALTAKETRTIENDGKAVRRKKAKRKTQNANWYSQMSNYPKVVGDEDSYSSNQYLAAEGRKTSYGREGPDLARQQNLSFPELQIIPSQSNMKGLDQVQHKPRKSHRSGQNGGASSLERGIAEAMGSKNKQLGMVIGSDFQAKRTSTQLGML